MFKVYYFCFSTVFLKWIGLKKYSNNFHTYNWVYVWNIKLGLHASAKVKPTNFYKILQPQKFSPQIIWVHTVTKTFRDHMIIMWHHNEATKWFCVNHKIYRAVPSIMCPLSCDHCPVTIVMWPLSCDHCHVTTVMWPLSCDHCLMCTSRALSHVASISNKGHMIITWPLHVHTCECHTTSCIWYTL